MTIFIMSIFAVIGILLSNYPSRIKTIFLGLLGLNLFLVCLHYIANTFSQAGINNAVFAHLHHLLNIDVLLRFWTSVLWLIGALTIVLVCLAWLSQLAKVKAFNVSNSFARFTALVTPIFVIIAVVINPFNTDLAHHFHQRILDKQFPYPKVFDNIDNLAPVISHISPQDKTNFVIIFAESLERSFLNNTDYPGLMPNLQNLISENGIEVKGINQTPISAWTDSGLIAALCGIAFSPNYSDNNLTGQQQTAEVTARTKAGNIIGESCIGDILAQDGYNMSFVGGSEFGMVEKKIHMQSQGFKYVFSTKDIVRSQETAEPTSAWGSFDDALFDFAQQKIPYPSNDPFGIVILTVDTHTPGYVAPSCGSNVYADGEDQLLNAVHCSDLLISKFINELMSKPIYKNTTIFLMSDHLYPGQLPKITRKMQDRENLWVVFNSRLKNVNQQRSIIRAATTLDSAPTILAHLGYRINTLNFGRNLMQPAPTLLESMGYETLSKHISKIRAKMNTHWKQNNSTAPK